MSSLAQIARPYAQAAFDVAKEDNALQQWDDSLKVLSSIAEDEYMQSALQNPHIKPADIQDMFMQIAAKVCGDNVITPKVENFFKLLLQNKRIAALPEVYQLYRDKRAEEERALNAKIYSAVELTADQKQHYVEMLTKRFDKNVQIEYVVDESMIGGAIVRAGDLVIDGSVRGQLAQLVDAVNG